MDRLHTYRRQLHTAILVSMLFFGVFVVGLIIVGHQLLPDSPLIVYGGAFAASAVLATLIASLISRYAAEPLDFIWRAIVHVSPNGNSVPAPNLDKSRVAPELVSSLVMQVYQLASSGHDVLQNKPEAADNLVQAITNNFPLPTVAVDKDQSVIFVNEAMQHYLGLPQAEILNKNFYSLFDLAFSDSHTIDGWLRDCRANKATDTHSWQRVRLKLANEDLKQFDMAASYSKEHPSGAEMIITLFDQTQRYQSDDQALDFIALAVHELRTPLTALQGYIEVFEDEFEGKLDPELKDFMRKMQASARQLTAFVNNILKVARLEEGQLYLQLTEEQWEPIVKEAVENMRQQAEPRGITIDYDIAPDLPTVGVDKVSITEVLNNLMDNAIKYSGKGKRISVVVRKTNDNRIETIVRDDGVGIPSSVMPHLFEKFHRNHRNQSKIGGTGLGLYLCHALVQAHGGNIWVKSKEGEGAAIGFTIQPYSAVADSQKGSHNKDITRNAHGWIKNHSLYRR